MRNRINENIGKFVRGNRDSGVVKQLKRANEERDREAFTQLIEKIRDAIQIQKEISYHEDMIKSHRLDIKEKKNELKNELYFHKIKRCK